MVPMRQPKVALQLPTWGGVSIQLPVPKAPLFRQCRVLGGNGPLQIFRRASEPLGEDAANP
jgi:hypothetical protein